MHRYPILTYIGPPSLPSRIKTGTGLTGPMISLDTMISIDKLAET